MATNAYALPPGSWILVTGANGYIASHVVDKLLELGYKVRGTVRSPKPWLNEFFEKKYGQGGFETVIAESFGDKTALEEIMDGVDGVIHLATDMTFSGDPHAIIPWVVKATLNILEVAAQKPSIKRVVLSSSSSAVYSMIANPNGRQIDINSWNDPAVTTAWDESIPHREKAMAVYAASKAESERGSWKWMEENKPHFEYNTIIPCFNVGTILHPNISGSTMAYVRKLLDGDPTVLSFPEQWFVDVEDVARLCIVGLLDETTQSERIFAFGEQSRWTDVVRTLRELRPSNSKIPDPPADEVKDRTDVLPRIRAKKLLREFYGQADFVAIRDSLRKGIEQLE